MWSGFAATRNAAEAQSSPEGRREPAREVTPGLLDRARAFDQAVDTLRRERSLRDSLWEVSEAFKQEVEATSNEAARLPLLHARAYLLTGAPGRAELAAIREGLDLARSRGDALAEMQFLVQLCGLHQAEGRIGEAESLLPRLVELSDAHQGTQEAARADYFVARRWIFSGRAPQALPIATRALSVFQDLERWDFVVNCESLIGLTGMLANDFHTGRTHLTAGIALGRRIQRDDLIVPLLGNLGTLENNAGRYDRALASYTEMKQVANRIDNPKTRGYALQTMSFILALMGRYGESIAEADSLLALAREMESPDLRARAYTGLAFARFRAGDVGGAARDARAVVTMGDSVDLSTQLDARLNLCQYLLVLDSLDASLDLARASAPLSRRMGVQYEIRAANAESQALRRTGRMTEAIAVLGRIRPHFDPQTPTPYTTSVMADLAGLYARNGNADSARSCVQLARASYLNNRQALDDDQWRELIAGEGSAIAAAELRIHLGETPATPEAIDTAFDLIEPLRSRTLIERIAGREEVDKASGVFATAADLRAALEDGELFLQWTVTEDTSVVFAFTRDAVSVYPLGIAADSLEQQAREVRRLMGERPGARDDQRTRALSAAAATLGGRMFAPVEEQLRSANRILVSPDGPLYQLPMVYLLRESVFGGALAGMPEVVSTPSATLLVRGREGARASGVGGLLAASGPAPDGSGELPGGRDEVRWLGRSFDPVTVRLSTDGQSDSAAFAGFEGLHFAAHAESNDLTPWRSGILLGDAADDADEGYVRASAIARMHIPARLAVLSACETAWGAIFTGEGLIGLSTAFLSAGVPTVVATQWKVDDRATIDFMKRFYRGLARGSTAAAALHAAQTAVAASSQRDPYYWAGFVLIGEPGTKLEIRGRPAPSPFLAGVLVVLIVAIAVPLLLARRRRPANA
jgi:CHAT domain-containing protein